MWQSSVLAASIVALIAPVSAIIGGESTVSRAHEYTVAVMQPALAGSTQPFICDGVLISQHSVITAAECVTGLEAQDITIRTAFDGSYLTHDVNKIVTMGTYNSTSLAGDIAMLNLTQAATRIKPAKLATNATYPLGEVTLCGWGGTKNSTQSLASSLQQVEVDVVRSSTCAAALSTCDFKLNTRQRFCTSSTATGAEGYGDVGGPVVGPDNVVIGLMTGSPACAQPNNLAIQLRLGTAKVQRFIDANKC